MKVDVVRLQDLDDSHRREWRRFQQQDERLSNPFLSPEFATAYGRHRSNVFVGVISDAVGTVGFFPFERMLGGAARSMAWDLTDVQAVIADPSAQWNGADLLRQCGLHAFEFDHFAPHQMEQLAPMRCKVLPAPVVDLANGYDGWLQAKAGSSRIRKALQKRRKLEREMGPLEFRYDSKDAADLDLLMRWKSAQYKRSGRRDRFGQQWFRDFVRELHGLDESGASLRLSVTRCGDRTIALYLSVRDHGRLAGWFPVYDEDLAHWSPGLVSNLLLLEAAAADGMSRLDLGEGEAALKESLKSHDDQVAEGWAQRATWAGHAHRLLRAPRRAALDFVLEHPRVRVAARTTLRRVGGLRTRLGASA